jgi:hypothetical protein
MKLFKGTIHDLSGSKSDDYKYFVRNSEGLVESSIDFDDIVQIIEPSTNKKYIFLSFPENKRAIKKYLGREGSAIWERAIKEAWPVEVVKIH